MVVLVVLVVVVLVVLVVFHGTRLPQPLAADGVMPVPPAQQAARGYSLHDAVREDSVERTVALLSKGSTDTNQRDSNGCTPLMYAAEKGCLPLTRILLNEGANVSIGRGDGLTALHLSAHYGHLAVTKMLLKAGPYLEASSFTQSTPLYRAANAGHWEVVRALTEAGANPNSRTSTGSTPLLAASTGGRVDVIRELLRAKADPLLTCTIPSMGISVIPLDAAADGGHSDVVWELIQQCGIEGCGGASGGVAALRQATQNQHLDIMAMLMDAGVIDTGSALVCAAMYCREASAKMLLQQQEGTTDERAFCYVNYRDLQGEMQGATPLLFAIMRSNHSSRSPRMVRLLIDAGADTTSPIRLTNSRGEEIVYYPPLALTIDYLRTKTVEGKYATEAQMHRLEAIRRLLLQVEAVHAVSWLWPSDVPSIAHTAEGAGRAKTPSTPLTVMLPTMRRRARSRGVLLAALFRYSKKL